MTGTDLEMREWMDAWQAAEAAPPPAAVREALLHRVKRRTLGLALLAASEAVLSAGVLVFLGWLVRRSPYPVDWALAAGLALLTVGALAFSLWHRRGVWRAPAETTAALLGFSLARARRRLRGLRAGWWLLGAELALFVPWIWLRLVEATGAPPAGADLAWSYGFLAVWIGGAATILAALGRWTRREIRRLEALRRELS
jgi:hypothetical protein